ncbi:MAG: ribonuclease HII [Cyanobacterium sp. T60_A2020_053]|nr:ribonuclease HII [Cyanobacterium sp. T60_A2020_053]
MNQLSLFDLIPNNYLNNLHDHSLIAGVDEVGRGCIFGEVVASVVVMPLKNISLLKDIGVDDSKKLTHQKRVTLVPKIKALVTEVQIAKVDAQTIDQINILQASLLAMKLAINQLKISPQLCLIDGNFTIPQLNYPQIPIIKGDSISPLIGAASIIAKVYRDQLMLEYSALHPEYDLAHNKGYPTAKHRRALNQFGITPHHRLSFSPVALSLSSLP